MVTASKRDRRSRKSPSRSSASGRLGPAARNLLPLRPRLEYQVERGLGATSELPEPSRLDDRTDPSFARLGPAL